MQFAPLLRCVSTLSVHPWLHSASDCCMLCVCAQSWGEGVGRVWGAVRMWKGAAEIWCVYTVTAYHNHSCANLYCLMHPHWPTTQETWRMIIPASHQFVYKPIPASEEFWAIHLWATTTSSPFPLCSAYSEQSAQIYTLVCVNIRWYKDKCHSFCSWPVAWWAWYSVGHFTVWPQVVWRSRSAHQCSQCLPSCKN